MELRVMPQTLVQRIEVRRKDEPPELAGHWAPCPQKGRLARIDDCIGCEHLQQVHLAGGGAPFIVCAPESNDERTAGDRSHRTTVAEIMTTPAVSVHASMPLEKLMLFLVDENISGVPVVDEAGAPLGMVSKTDLLCEQGERYDLEEIERAFPPVGELTAKNRAEPVERTAGDLMSRPLLTIDQTATVARAAALMTAHHVHRLAATDAAGRLVGMVTTSDIVRWLSGA